MYCGYRKRGGKGHRLQHRRRCHGIGSKIWERRLGLANLRCTSKIHFHQDRGEKRMKKTLTALAIASIGICGAFAAHPTTHTALAQTIHRMPRGILGSCPTVAGSAPIYSASGHQIGGVTAYNDACAGESYTTTYSTNGPYSIKSCTSIFCSGPTAGVTSLNSSPPAAWQGCPISFDFYGYIIDSAGYHKGDAGVIRAC